MGDLSTQLQVVTAELAKARTQRDQVIEAALTAAITAYSDALHEAADWFARQNLSTPPFWRPAAVSAELRRMAEERTTHGT